MKSRIIGYRMKIDTLLAQLPEDVQWEPILQEHLTQVSFFQHERLVHLIVTVTFAILTMIALAIYIGHYYTLENEVQKMYRQYDEILRRVKRET